MARLHGDSEFKGQRFAKSPFHIATIRRKRECFCPHCLESTAITTRCQEITMRCLEAYYILMI